MSYKTGTAHIASATLCAMLAAPTLLTPHPALAELRPLVREMLENLGAVNHLGEGVALEDYDVVREAAEDLKKRAAAMQNLDIATLGLDSARDKEFDAFLKAQAEAADAILEASKREISIVEIDAPKCWVSR